MPSIQYRGNAVSALRLGEQHVIKAYLGTVLLFDGTHPVLFTVKLAESAWSAPGPVVCAGAVLDAASPAPYVLSAASPAVSSGQRIEPPVAASSWGSGAVRFSGGVWVYPPSADMGWQAFAGRAGMITAITVNAPAALETWAAPSPIVQTGAKVNVFTASMSWTAHPAVFQSPHIEDVLTTANMLWDAPAPDVHGGVTITPTTGSMSWTAHAPDWRSAITTHAGTAGVMSWTAHPAEFQSGLLFTDDFNRPDERLDASPNWIDRTYFGGNYAQVLSNQLDRTGAGRSSQDVPDAAVWQTPTQTGDQFAMVTITTITGDQNGAGVIVASAADGKSAAIHAAVQSDSWKVFVATPGSGSIDRTLMSGTDTSFDDDTVLLSRNGDTVRLYIQGAKVGETTNANLPTGSYVGVRPGSGGYESDDWQGGDLSQAPALPDAYLLEQRVDLTPTQWDRLPVTAKNDDSASVTNGHISLPDGTYTIEATLGPVPTHWTRDYYLRLAYGGTTTDYRYKNQSSSPETWSTTITTTGGTGLTVSAKSDGGPREILAGNFRIIARPQ